MKTLSLLITISIMALFASVSCATEEAETPKPILVEYRFIEEGDPLYNQGPFIQFGEVGDHEGAGHIDFKGMNGAIGSGFDCTQSGCIQPGTPMKIEAFSVAARSFSVFFKTMSPHVEATFPVKNTEESKLLKEITEIFLKNGVSERMMLIKNIILVIKKDCYEQRSGAALNKGGMTSVGLSTNNPNEGVQYKDFLSVKICDLSGY